MPVLSSLPKKKKEILIVSIFILFGACISLAMSNKIFFILLGISYDDLNPFAFFKYGWIAWHENVMGKWLFALCIPPAVAGALAAFAVYKGNQRHLFGKAHWASMVEAKKAGLFSNEGLIIGKKWGKHLRVGGFEHVFVFAPSGSGKSTSIVIPNLFEWNGSVIVQDVKLTLFEITSLFRQTHGQSCYVWNPGAHDCRTHCYNPLDFVSRDKVLRVDDLQKIANIFIPDHPQKDPIWTAQPRVLFVAIALYLYDTPDRPATIGEMLRVIKNTKNFSEWISETLKTRNDLDPLCYRNFSSYLQTDYRLQTNILQSFLSYFELFDNPIVDAATSKSDFDITELRKKKMTIYVGITPDNLYRFSPLLTVFYQQALDILLRNVPDPKKEPHPMLFIIDEFSALRRMTALQKSIGLLREYRVRMMPVIQDLSQLNETYGVQGAKSFINTKVRIAFAQNDFDTAKLISGWLGNKTAEQLSHNQNSLFSDREGFGSRSLSLTKVELMQPSEIMQLDWRKSIILIEGNPPVLANKLFWYESEAFKKRSVGEIDLPVIKPNIVPFDHASLQKGKSETQKNDDELEEELFEESI